MLDGLSELWFPSIEAMRQAVASPTYAPVAADTPSVMTMPGIVAGTQAGRGSANALAAGDKLLLIATRAATIDADTFAQRWDGGQIATALAGVSHAVDTFVTHWESAPGIEISREELPLDLVVELWFEDTATLRAAARQLADGLGDTAGHLLGDAALYRTQTHVIVDRSAAASGAGQ
ncbi:hypothetical protein [Pseudaminobacter salicylatoxidans]|uniref:hypothetical protein n=1 Tax=Pseudaminobacter salicylatoxidans TaxID=93369 RepID=UPI0002F43297|nr:hypothetical protein [Pseudaminobacter salicylatoxidans]